MATFRKISIAGNWYLMSPSNPIEAIRMAWMMWRHPDRVAALVGLPDDFTAAKLSALGQKGVSRLLSKPGRELACAIQEAHAKSEGQARATHRPDLRLVK